MKKLIVFGLIFLLVFSAISIGQTTCTNCDVVRMLKIVVDQLKDLTIKLTSIDNKLCKNTTVSFVQRDVIWGVVSGQIFQMIANPSSSPVIKIPLTLPEIPGKLISIDEIHIYGSTVNNGNVAGCSIRINNTLCASIPVPSGIDNYHVDASSCASVLSFKDLNNLNLDCGTTGNAPTYIYRIVYYGTWNTCE